MRKNKRINLIIINLLIIVFLITGCGLKNITQPKKSMDLVNRKILMVVSPIDFRDEEYTKPREVLENAGAMIKVASIQGGIAKGVAGAEVDIDMTVGEVNVDEFDAVVFVGGPGMAQIVNDESLQVLAQKFNNAEKLTTAICVAPAILANAGILKMKKATSHSDAEQALNTGSALFTGELVTKDGKIITANGHDAAQEFGEKIMEVLSGK